WSWSCRPRGHKGTRDRERREHVTPVVMLARRRDAPPTIAIVRPLGPAGPTTPALTHVGPRLTFVTPADTRAPPLAGCTTIAVRHVREQATRHKTAAGHTHRQALLGTMAGRVGRVQAI